MFIIPLMITEDVCWLMLFVFFFICRFAAEMRMRIWVHRYFDAINNGEKPLLMYDDVTMEPNTVFPVLKFSNEMPIILYAHLTRCSFM